MRAVYQNAGPPATGSKAFDLVVLLAFGITSSIPAIVSALIAQRFARGASRRLLVVGALALWCLQSWLPRFWPLPT